MKSYKKKNWNSDKNRFGAFEKKVVSFWFFS